jgi:SNF2-related domain/Bacterial SNF2 helicase associated/Helicase conserved C-terminal domain/SWIM zinc finger
MTLLYNERFSAYLASFSNATVRDRGQKIFEKGRLSLKKIEEKGMGEANYTVLSDGGYEDTFYRVKVTGFASQNSILLTSCSCLYNQGGICKHRVAAVIALDQKLHFNPIATQIFKMEDSVFDFKQITEDHLSQNTPADLWKLKNHLKNIKITYAKDGLAEIEIKYKKEEFHVRFEKVAKGQINTSCTCKKALPLPLCEHKAAALLVLKKEFGKQAFEVLKDWTTEKNRLLAEYGFSLADDIVDKFDFKVNDEAKLILVELDPSIQKLSQFQHWETITKKLFVPVKQNLISAANAEESKYEQMLVYTFTEEHPTDIPDFTISAISAKYNQKTGKFTKTENLLGRYIQHLPSILPIDTHALKTVASLEKSEIESFVRKANLNANWYFRLNREFFTEESHDTLQEWIGEKYDTLLQQIAHRRVFWAENSYSTVNEMQEINLSLRPITIGFELTEKDEFLVLKIHRICGGEKLNPTQFTSRGFWFGNIDNTFYKLKDLKHAKLAAYFDNKKEIKVKKDNFEGFLSDFIVPLSGHAEVDFNLTSAIETQPMAYIETRVFLKEDDHHLIITPAFVYEDFENPTAELQFGHDGRKQTISHNENAIFIHTRNSETENNIYAFLEGLHPLFETQTQHPFFYVPFQDVLKDNWLFDFFEKTTAGQISVFGYKELQKLKYNPNRPKMNIRSSSSIDWFDMSVEITFGDQFVSLPELKRALVKKQNYIELKDGSLGMLPEEWLKKYANLFKMGSIQDGVVKLSKLHFNIIEELIGEIDDDNILQELQEKKQKLLHFKEIKEVAFPTNINATLRDYQVEGYKWLNFLDEFRWGGCLADDMGLGKTLQMLTFLQEQQNKHPEGTHLVVLPTTLIFNWQAEAEKFCPDLKYYVHRGVLRSKNIAFFKDYDLILTTYGTIRSDIQLLKDFSFNYIVLDESQAIKNPDSLISKAVRLLSAKNRLVMTGTPVENNTFDIYSQMEFVNPGFLGSKEYFKTEYATPIDKYQDKEAALKLRNLLKPFLLKRTKEEVAKDLPEKTETILYCEMDKKQRKVYDSFREMYRLRIVDKMATEGKDKSAFLILEGLLKLRQICDSPELLPDDADYGKESVKLEEILREIEENASNHKIVIFSQFLKMLDLIKQNLEKNNIPYEYLDGQTTDRADRVNHFQSDQNCRVFLMSLKAGGVGINLTEADYVYLVDPWWNPAVEQQAIDRTHRIGQKKNVFAYRMICKDTIEEKILLLQAKKKDIANDLISTEAGFIKKLTRDDIVELFS